MEINKFKDGTFIEIYNQNMNLNDDNLKNNLLDIRNYLYNVVYPKIFYHFNTTINNIAKFEKLIADFSCTLSIDKILNKEEIEKFLNDNNLISNEKSTNNEELIQWILLRINMERAISEFYKKYYPTDNYKNSEVNLYIKSDYPFNIKYYYFAALKKFNELEKTSIKYLSSIELMYDLDNLMSKHPEFSEKTIKSYIITRIIIYSNHITPLYVETQYDNSGKCLRQNILFMDSIPDNYIKVTIPLENKEFREIKILDFHRQASKIGCFEDSLLLLKNFYKIQNFSNSSLSYSSFQNNKQLKSNNQVNYIQTTSFPNFLFLHLEVWNQLRLLRKTNFDQIVDKFNFLEENAHLEVKKYNPDDDYIILDRSKIYSNTILKKFNSINFDEDSIISDNDVITSGKYLFSDNLNYKVYLRNEIKNGEIINGQNDIYRSQSSVNETESDIIKEKTKYEFSYVNFEKQKNEFYSKYENGFLFERK